MYGFIYNTLRNLLVDNFGLETWNEICDEAGADLIKDGILDRQYYDESYLGNITRVASSKLGVDAEKIFEMFGAFFFQTCKKSGHSNILRTLGHNLYGFLLNLDTLHDHLSFTYTQMRAPSFRCEKTPSGLTLYYHSPRPGLGRIVTGIVKAVAKDFYQLDIIVTQVSYEETDGKLPYYYVFSIEVEESAKNGNYLERLTGDICAPHSLALPRLDDEQEMQFDPNDLNRRYPHIMMQHGLEASSLFSGGAGVGDVCPVGRGGAGVGDVCPVGREASGAVCPVGDEAECTPKRVAALSNETKDLIREQMLKVGSGSDRLPLPFLPSLSMSRYQSRRGSMAPGEAGDIWPVTANLFQLCFPFHIIFDKDLVIRYMGVSMTRLLPKAIATSAKLTDCFSLDRPKLSFTYRNIRTSLHNSFVLFTNSSVVFSTSENQKEALYFRGQMVLTSRFEGAPILFLCSPRVSSVEELENQGLYLSDIPVHDVTRDLLLLNRHFRVEMTIAAELEETKNLLEIQKACVEREKLRADQLLHTMLPPTVASQLQSQGEARAMDYDSVTILFSDIKGFTTICSSVNPMEVVGLLNTLYTLFDYQSEKFKVYKVETIGDAYMVAAGLLDTPTLHAEAITNMAFGMMEEAGKVMEPGSDLPLQIRIGIHTGPVVAGVVGRKMPRYCLFGDSVNTASRMESHGEPGKVHLSEDTYSHIKGDPRFRFQSRGRIFIKGLGERQTYFVELVGEGSESSVSTDSTVPKKPTPSRLHPSTAEEEKKGGGLHRPAVVDITKPHPPMEEAWTKLPSPQSPRLSAFSFQSFYQLSPGASKVAPLDDTIAETAEVSKNEGAEGKPNPSVFYIGSTPPSTPSSPPHDASRRESRSKVKCVIC